MEEVGFSHFTVNHKYNSVDPKMSVHTQNVKKCEGLPSNAIKKEAYLIIFTNWILGNYVRKYAGKKNNPFHVVDFAYESKFGNMA